MKYGKQSVRRRCFFSYDAYQLLSLALNKEIPALYLGRKFSYSVSVIY